MRSIQFSPSRLSVMLLSCALAGGGVASAEDRALLISVSQYQDGSQLAGVAKDLVLMREAVGKLGFSTSQIKEVSNAAATKQGILRAIESQLVSGVKPTDRVFLYFSGHGTQLKDENGDEPDGCDEALVPYDMDNLLSDDELNLAMQRIPANNILMVIDSCFSGTISKSRSTSTGQAVFPKFKSPKSGVNCAKATNVMASKASDAQGRGTATYGVDSQNNTKRQQVTMTAAAPDEVALTVSQGSFFTFALHERIMAAQGPVSFAELREYAADFARRTLEELGETSFSAQHPQLEGPAALLHTDILAFGRSGFSAPDAPPLPEITRVNNGRELLDRYLNTSGFNVSIASSKSNYRLGEPIEYTVYTSDNGYLNLLELDDDGNIAVLFPNKYNQKNAVKAGQTYKLPSNALGNFKFVASEPLGKTRVVALVSAAPLNLFNTSGNLEGEYRVLLNLDHFRKMAEMMKGTGVMPLPTGNRHGASSTVVEVQP